MTLPTPPAPPPRTHRPAPLPPAQAAATFQAAAVHGWEGRGVALLVRRGERGRIDNGAEGLDDAGEVAAGDLRTVTLRRALQYVCTAIVYMYIHMSEFVNCSYAKTGKAAVR